MNQPRVCIVATFPNPRLVNNRLFPHLGPTEAARLQDALTRHALAIGAALAQKRPVEVELRGCDATPAGLQGRYRQRGVSYASQGEGELGERLSRAADDAGDRPVLFVLARSMALTADLLDRALAALSIHPVVLMPTSDGSPCLIGVRNVGARFFAGFRGESAGSVSQLQASAREMGLSVAMLDPLGEIASNDAVNSRVAADKPADYHPSRLALTGATGSLGGHFLEMVLDELPQTHVTALVRTSSDTFRAPSFQFLISKYASRLTLIDADLRSARLSPLERRQLVEADGGLWHFAASTNLHAASADANQRIRDINEGGTYGILDTLAASDRPGPFYYVSTAYVCGRRTGAIYEHELKHDCGFRNTYEESKNTAEIRVREALDAGLNGMVFRPSLVVADQPGNGPAHITELLMSACKSAAERHIRLTLRIPPQAAINAVHDDWTTRALLSLAPFSAARRTYHLTARKDVTMVSFAKAASSIFEGLDLCLATTDAPIGPSMADRLADRMLTPFRPYCDARAKFDRRNLELDAPHLADEADVDPMALLLQRTKRELGAKIA